MPFDDKVRQDAKGMTLDVPEYFFYMLFQAQRRREMAFDAALADGELNINRWRTLSVIRRIQDCTMKDLARFTAIDRTTLTRSVDQLVEQGIVQRTTPPGDRRKVVLTLTETGVTFFEAALSILTDFNNRALQGVSRERQAVVVEVLQTILQNLCTPQDQAADLLSFGIPARRTAAA